MSNGTGNGNGLHVEILWPPDAAPVNQLASLIEAMTEVITQDAVAALFEERCRERALYDWSSSSWYVWTGVFWRKDEHRLTLEAVRQACRAASAKSEGKLLKEIRSINFASGVERLCRSSPVFSVIASEWNADPMLLGTPGGTLDLATGDLRPSRPEERITRQTLIAPAGDAVCPQWVAFLIEANGGDEDTVLFLQRWCGYVLTGRTIEHALVFLHGPGGNGKSVFINVIAKLMGSYAAVAPMETFIDARGDRHPTELAFLDGPRLVVASETERGRAWNETRIKQVTGGDPISARHMREDFYTFTPVFKLTLVGNHAPRLKTVNEATLRRFNIVPFICKPQDPDRKLEERLIAEEGPQILRWMIAGCVEWLGKGESPGGLLPSERVLAATSRYFERQDTLRRWLEERCETGDFNTDTTSLYEDYISWMESEGLPHRLSKNDFSDMLADRGFERQRTMHSRSFRGLRLLLR